MNMFSQSLPKLMLALAPLGRILAMPFRPGPPRIPYADLAEFSDHMQRDIGLRDGHATPSGRRRPLP